MKKQHKMILIGAIVVVLLIFAYFRYKAYKLRKDLELLNSVTNAPSTTPSTSGGTSSGVSTDDFPLKIGSKGGNVKAAQIALNNAGCLYGANIAEDGVYGPITAGAANSCLQGQPGHITDKITYAEFIFLKNKAIAGGSGGGVAGAGQTQTTGIQQLAINSCGGTPTQKTWFENTYGVKCSYFGL